MTQEWINTQNGINTMQSIARNLEKLTEETITPRDLFAAAALCGMITALNSTEVGIRVLAEEDDPAKYIAEAVRGYVAAMMEARER